MTKLKWLSVLMGVAIAAITGFQVYWLKQNYDREKKSLHIKTDMAFRETILKLQVAKLKLDSVSWNGTTGNKDVKIFMKDEGGVRIRKTPKAEVVSTINVIGDKLKDSLRKGNKARMLISLNKTSVDINADTTIITNTIQGPGLKKGNHILNLLYSVDSLQDSIRVTEIDSAYASALQEEKLSIPFTIAKLDSSSKEEENDFNEVTIGLAHPATYKLQLGNTFPYLIKQITQPILFSILLLGITLLSFVLLYRNLLKQRRLAALKNEFISNITHELKTPIATVGVAIEALKNFNAMDNPERTREYLDISTNELQRLSLLVDKVLKLSMFEKKEMELKYEVVNLKSIAEEVITSLKLQLERRKAQVSLNTTGNVSVQGDRLHLLSVVFNLLDNALKYCSVEPIVAITINETENAVVLTVKDNGIGVAPEYREKIFEKFFRIPHGDTHDAKGYGLGLSYVAQVIRQHNGTIIVASQPGDGTIFTITLPKAPTLKGSKNL